MTFDALITKIQNMDSLLSIDDIWGAMNGTILNDICIAAGCLGFLALSIKILLKVFKEGPGDLPSILVGELLKVAIIMGIFAVPAIYKVLANVSILLFNASNGAFKQEILDAQGQMRFFFMVMGQHANDSVSIFNPETWGAGIFMVIFSVVMHVNIFLFYVIGSLGPIYLGFALITGPLFMAFSIWLDGISKRWLMMLIGSVFYQLCAGLAIITLGSMTLYAGMAQYADQGLLNLAVIIGLTNITVLLVVPILYAKIFDNVPFDLASRIFGWMVGFTGIMIAPVLVESLKSVLAHKSKEQ